MNRIRCWLSYTIEHLGDSLSNFAYKIYPWSEDDMDYFLDETPRYKIIEHDNGNITFIPLCDDEDCDGCE